MTAIPEVSDESMSEYNRKESSVSVKLSFRESAVKNKTIHKGSEASSKKKFSQYLKPVTHCSE